MTISTILPEFLEKVSESIVAKNFLGIKLSKSTDQELLQIEFTQFAGEERISAIFTHRSQSITKHLSPSELQDELRRQIGNTFLSATLFTEVADYSLDHNRRREASLVKRRATKKREHAEHNRKKDYLVPESADFLQLLGISGPKGIRAAMSHKFRQLNKFVEIFDAQLKNSPLKASDQISVCDLGAGKSYLTFAVEYHLKTNLKKSVSITAIERRAELCKEGRVIADRLGSSIEFIDEEISNYQQGADVFVALHACDTATDDAIIAAVNAKAKVILLAPCCQKWLRGHPELTPKDAAFMQDGIIKERYLSMLTDLIRAAALEKLGFQSKVFEFIGSEDTDKNLMISGVFKGAQSSTRCDKLNGYVDYREYYLFKKLKEAGYEL